MARRRGRGGKGKVMSPYKAAFDIDFPNEPDEGIPYRLRRYCQPAFWHAGMRSGAGL